MARGRIRNVNGQLYINIVDDAGNETTRSVKKELGLKRQPTEKEATKLLHDKLYEIEHGKIAYDAKILLTDFLQMWLDSKRIKVEPETVNLYKRELNHHIIPYLGEVRLNKLNKPLLQKTVSKMIKDGKSAYTIKFSLEILGFAMDKAVEWDMLTKNPTKGLELPKQETMEKAIWTDEELMQFLEINKDDKHILIYLLAITTGMRRGEILALQWDDIDFDSKTISIKRTLTSEVRIKTAKTQNSIRTINVPTFIMHDLRKHKIKQAEDLLASRMVNPNKIVFFNKATQGYFWPQSILSHFKILCKKANVPAINIHRLRHLHVSMLYAEGIDIKTIQKRVGHANIATTMNIYAHLMDNPDQEAAAKIENRLSLANGAVKVR